MADGAPPKGATPTVNDVARAAGVSLATVDRVVNDRPGVRPATVAKVREAIARLGYVRDTAAANLARRKVHAFAFLLPDTDNEFVAALSAGVAAQEARPAIHRTRLRVVPVPPFDPQATADALDAQEGVDGVAVFGPETPAVRDAVRRARARGIAVAALVSDLPSSERDHFVGIDNVRAGRTAAQLMGRFVHRPGRVLVLTGSRLSRDHLERRQGFDRVVAEHFPHLAVGATVEGRDDPDRVAALLSRAFADAPDLVGVYSSAAGNAGLIRAMAGLPRDLVVIAHELTPTTRAALAGGTFDALISQDAGHLVRSAVRLLRATADGVPHDPAQERIRIDVHLRENVPPPTSEETP